MLEAFTYADGNLETVAGSALWKTYATAFGSPSTTVVPVASNKIGGWFSTTRGEAIYQPALVLTNRYAVKIAFTIHNVNSSNMVRVWARENVGTPLNNAITLSLAFGTLNTTSTLGIGVSTASTTGIASQVLPANMFVAGNSYVLELRVEDNLVSGLVDGVLYCSGTSNNKAAEVGVGFGMSTGSASLTPAELDNFIAEPLVASSGGVRGLSGLVRWRR